MHISIAFSRVSSVSGTSCHHLVLAPSLETFKDYVYVSLREPVIVFECLDMSIGQRVNVSGLPCVSNRVLGCWDSYKVICDLIHHQEFTVHAPLVQESPV